MKRTIFYAFLVGFPMGIWTGIMIEDHDPPTIIGKVAVSPPEVNPGGILNLKIDAYRIKSDCTYIETRVFVGADLIRRPLVLEPQHQSPHLGQVVEERAMRVPISLPDGPAELATTLTYRCGANLLHRWWPITVGPIRVKFTVVGDPVLDGDGAGE